MGKVWKEPRVFWFLLSDMLSAVFSRAGNNYCTWDHFCNSCKDAGFNQDLAGLPSASAPWQPHIGLQIQSATEASGLMPSRYCILPLKGSNQAVR
eukprot:3724212-Amphidinium_carterae.1